MSKFQGYLARIYANGWNLSYWVKGGSYDPSREAHDVTTQMSAGAREFQTGLSTANWSAAGFFEYDDGDMGADSGQGDTAVQFQEFGAGETVIVTEMLSGDNQGDPCILISGPNTGHGISNDVEGMVEADVELTASGHTHYGQVLQPLITSTDDTEGDGLDNGAATSAGAIFYAQVFAVNGIDPELTITIEDSADGISFATLTTLTLATGRGAQVKETTGTVRRHLRVAPVLGVDTDDATYNVAVSRLKA